MGGGPLCWRPGIRMPWWAGLLATLGGAEAQPVPCMPPLTSAPRQEMGQGTFSPPQTPISFLQCIYKKNFRSPISLAWIPVIVQFCNQKREAPQFNSLGFFSVCGFLNKYFINCSGHILDLVVSGAWQFWTNGRTGQHTGPSPAAPILVCSSVLWSSSSFPSARFCLGLFSINCFSPVAFVFLSKYLLWKLILQIPAPGALGPSLFNFSFSPLPVRQCLHTAIVFIL